MVSIKDATQSAILFATDALGKEGAKEIRLEEVDSAIIDSRDCWLITLSVLDRDAH